jgi:hypothetical protein
MTGNCLNIDRSVGINLYALAEILDVDAHEVRASCIVGIIPNVFEELVRRKRFSRMDHEVVYQVELNGCEGKGAMGQVQLKASAIEFGLSYHQLVVLGRGPDGLGPGTTQDGLYAQDQFLGVERFGQIIVGAHPKPFNDITLFAFGGEKENR